MSRRGGGKYLRKADQVPSNKLSSPFIRAVSLSKGKTLYVSWYHCVTVGGLSLIHCFKIHLLARKRSLSQSLKSVLLRDSVFEGKLNMKRPGSFVTLIENILINSLATLLQNLAIKRHSQKQWMYVPTDILHLMQRGQDHWDHPVIHLVKNEWCYVGSMEYLILGFSRLVASKCGFGGAYCFMPVIFDKLSPKIAFPLLCYLPYIQWI